MLKEYHLPNLKWWQWVIIAFSSFYLLVFWGHFANNSTQTPAKTAQTQEDVQVFLDLAVKVIKQNNLVKDAAIVKNNNFCSMVLFIDYSASHDYAIKLGENFIRSTIGFVDEDQNLGKEIGRTMNTYSIGIYHSDKSLVAEGVKYPLSKEVKWK